jgi:hypothetical protein
MAKTGTDWEQYVDAWAEMMITIWLESLDMHEVGISERPSGKIRYSSGELRKSLDKEVIRQSGGDPGKIKHVFSRYALYVAAGIGPEFGKEGRLGKNRNKLGQFEEYPGRKAKPWYSGKYWYSKQKLQQAQLEYTGTMYLQSISNILTGNS